MHDNCIFCQIVEKKIAANILHETENLLAFYDVNPAAPHHVLVIPKKHIASVNELTLTDSTMLGEMVLLAKTVAESLAVHDSGFRLVINTGSDAGQSVSHMHLHVLGGRELGWPPG
ncbi:MAG: histidine triad nucleotide-binding protein [bacterium]|nr:histidine triad nucleotide-binding protein [bacterium]